MRREYTPGPWIAHERNEPVGYAPYEIHFSDDGECVAEVVHEKADAILIAAAPRLLEALENMVGVFNNPISKRKICGDTADKARAEASDLLEEILPHLYR